MTFQDHFSAGADTYRRSRPGYPSALFDWLAGLVPARRLAWDCATGSGQAARPLAARFRSVVATDASLAQLDQAIWHPRVAYRLATAESAPLPDASADLVTVAQAVHWLDAERFFAQARRVLKPRGVVALWGYGLLRTGTEELDGLIDRLYTDTLGPYWPPERRLVDRGLVDIELPFESIAPPPFAMAMDWSRGQLVGYLSTWSSVTRYRAERGTDPLHGFAAALSRRWPDAERRLVRWPLHLRVGRAEG